ncbi:MAG TPA: ester cyclase [Opitutaceae bacterium]|nr:ester cyclase [Opitutaceae bacterium]
MTPQELKRFIARYTNEVWNKANVAAIDRYYAPNYLHHDTSRPDVRTLADYKAWATSLLTGLKDMNIVADDLIAEDDKVVKRWTASGIHHAAIAGIAPTGQPVTFSGMSLYRVENERIVESWYAYDLFGLLHQLGGLPKQ